MQIGSGCGTVIMAAGSWHSTVNGIVVSGQSTSNGSWIRAQEGLRRGAVDGLLDLGQGVV